MSTPCSVQMYAEPITSSLEDLDEADLDVFYALVIVNPFGPTLTFVASVGKSTLNAALSLVKVMLNPFSQTVEQVGRFTVGDTWIPQQGFEPLIALDYGSCPILVLASNQIQEESRQQVGRMRQLPDKTLRDLSPKPGASSGGGFLARLFGRKS